MTERDMELFRDIQEQALQVKLHIEAEQSGSRRAQEAGLMVWWGNQKSSLVRLDVALQVCSSSHYRLLAHCSYFGFAKDYIALIATVNGAYDVYFLTV